MNRILGQFWRASQLHTKNSKIIMTSKRLFASGSSTFESAQERLKTLTDEPSNDVKLQLYALFKQATIGECNTKKPGMLDIVGKAKWDAWKALGALPTDDAKTKYVTLVDSLVGSAGAQEPTIVSEKHGNVLKIRLNRPVKKNALTTDMYRELTRLLHEAGKDPDCKVTVLTGTGDYYCSGNDLGNFAVQPSEIGKMAQDASVLLREFVDAFINHPNLLVSLVNGPAIGISVTVLGLCDFVYASDKATFLTPFPQVGQTPEGCSTYLFPQLMGPKKALKVLLGQKLTAQQAAECNLITDVIPGQNFEAEAWKKVQELSALPPQMAASTKRMIRDPLRKTLIEVNKEECEVLKNQWQSEECVQAILDFFAKQKSKI